MGRRKVRKPTNHFEDYLWSKDIGEHLTDESILDETEKKTSSAIKREKTSEAESWKGRTIGHADQKKHQKVSLALKKGESNWLNFLPLTKHDFNRGKSEFRDGLHPQHGKETKKLPKTCPCDQQFTIIHALLCPKR